MTPPLASTVNCRKCSVKPDLNQNAMIWLLPIFHSWKSPETGDLCHVSKNAGLWRGGYKRGLPAGGHCKGLVYSSQGLVYSSLGLVYSDRTIGFSGLAEYMFYNLSSQQRPFRERLFTTRGIFLGDVIWKCEDRQTTNGLHVFLSTFANWQCSEMELEIKHLLSHKIYFPIMTSANVSFMGQLCVKAPWIGLNRASDSRVGSSTWLFVG